MWSSRGDSARTTAWTSRIVLTGALAAFLVLVGSAGAAAHAVLAFSDPAPGANLRTTPAVVTLVFDEPLVATLSRASVTTPTGRSFPSTVSGRTMQVRLDRDSSGIYRVEWRTVSRVDGHTIQGAFRFGVGTRVTGAFVTAPSPTTADAGLSVLRGLEYTLLMLACGMALLRRLGREQAWSQPCLPVASALLLSGVLVVGMEVAVAGSGLSLRQAADYLGNGLTGWARAARLVLEMTLLLVAAWRRRFSVLVLAAIIGAIAVAGHGADVEPAWQGMAVNAAHLAAAGVWAGGILALAMIRLLGPWSEVGRPLLQSFSRVALWAFAASVGLGAVQAYQLLGGPRALVSTAYGWTLLVKVAAVGVMVPLSWLAWRRRREHLRGEAALALTVTAAAAALAAFPLVPKGASEAADVGPAAHAVGQSAFPRPGDLTMGGRAGSVMVGLTLRPGVPGRNRVTVYLASPATRATIARVAVQGRSLELRASGPRCRTGIVKLRGGQPLMVHVAGHGTATYHLPALPAPDGTDVVRTASHRMAALRSYRVRENLSGFRSRYVYAVPHRMFVRTWFGDGGHDTLWLGRRLYARPRPKAAWRRQPNAELAPVPYYPWYPFRPLADARIVDRTRVGDRRVMVVTTFGGHGKQPEPVWFTLWVDRATGAVLRSRMWAPNHFMVDRYTDFDAAIRLPGDPSPARRR